MAIEFGILAIYLILFLIDARIFLFALFFASLAAIPIRFIIECVQRKKNIAKKCG